MTQLSPKAQAIVKAFDDRYELLGPLEDDWQEQCIAVAIRKLADHGENLYDPHEGKVAVVRIEQLLAIATELKTNA
jgi:hypothetical protein